MSFVQHESILRAPYKWGLNSTFLATISESATVSKIMADAMNGKKGKEQEFKLIKALARLEILTSQVVYFMEIKADVDKQIAVELDALTNAVLTPGGSR